MCACCLHGVSNVLPNHYWSSFMSSPRPMDIVSIGHYVHWTQCPMDVMCNGHNVQWTPLNTIVCDVQWTPCPLDITMSIGDQWCQLDPFRWIQWTTSPNEIGGLASFWYCCPLDPMDIMIIGHHVHWTSCPMDPMDTIEHQWT